MNFSQIFLSFRTIETELEVELESVTMFVRKFENQFFFPVIKKGSSKNLNMWIYFNGIPSMSSEYQSQIELKNENSKITFQAPTMPINKYQDTVTKNQTCLVLSKQMLKNLELTKATFNVLKVHA